MRHHDDRVALRVELLEERHDLLAGLGVEITGRLVGEDDGRIVDEGARDGDALALAAGEFVGFVAHALAEADVFERAARLVHAAALAEARVDERQLDVVQRVGARQEIECLENETDLAVADVGELVVDHGGDVLAVELVAAGRRRIETAEHVHERRLARAGRAHDGEVFVAMDLQRDAAQGVDGLGAHLVELGHVLDLNDEGAVGARDAGTGVSRGRGRDHRAYFFWSVLGFSTVTVMPSLRVRVITLKLPLTTSSPSLSPDLISR